MLKPITNQEFLDLLEIGMDVSQFKYRCVWLGADSNITSNAGVVEARTWRRLHSNRQRSTYQFFLILPDDE